MNSDHRHEQGRPGVAPTGPCAAPGVLLDVSVVLDTASIDDLDAFAVAIAEVPLDRGDGSAVVDLDLRAAGEAARRNRDPELEPPVLQDSARGDGDELKVRVVTFSTMGKAILRVELAWKCGVHLRAPRPYHNVTTAAVMPPTRHRLLQSASLRALVTNCESRYAPRKAAPQNPGLFAAHPERN